LQEFADDIKAHGLHENVKIELKQKPGVSPLSPDDIYEEILLDGRNRLDAMELAGLPIFQRGTAELNPDIYDVVPDETDPVAYVIGVNIRRRHLTGEQKRSLVADLLKSDPARSNRATAEIVHVDDKTVASVRNELEATAEIPQLKTRTGKDGKARPATKLPEKAAVPMKPATVTHLAPMSGRERVIALAEGVASCMGLDMPLGPPTTTKISKIARTRVGGFVGAASGLLLGIEEAKPETITLIVQEMTDRQATWKEIEALRDWLSYLLASSKAKREQAKCKSKAPTPPTVPETKEADNTTTTTTTSMSATPSSPAQMSPTVPETMTTTVIVPVVKSISDIVMM
jgi:hypothetical protein